MSYQTERDQFVARMATEGLPIYATVALLRAATTLQRYAELACGSEAADRDRVPCPASRKGKPGPCLCDDCQDPGDAHGDITRIALLGDRLERRIVAMMPDSWRADFQGDPRGYVLRVIPPSYAERNQGRDRCNLESIGVPSGPTRLRF